MAGAVATYAACQTGCNTAWVACCGALGYTAGTFTAGSGVPAALATCSTAQGTCMAACAAMAGLTGVAEVGATAAAATATGTAAAGSVGAATYWVRSNVQRVITWSPKIHVITRDGSGAERVIFT